MNRTIYLNAAILCFFISILLCMALLMGGCSNASKKTRISLPQTVKLTLSIPVETTPGETDETPFTINIEQVVTLSGLDLVTDTSQDQKSDGKLALPVGFGGSAPTANVAGELDQGDIDANYEKDESQEDVGNPQDNSIDNSSGGAVVPVGSVASPSSDPGASEQAYNSIFTVKDIRTLGKRTWERFAKNTTTPGSTFGGPVLVKWPDVGQEFFVPNAAVDYAPNGSAGNAWTCGTMSDPGESQGETGGVWGPPGATYYEIHYNK